jgi:uncharacterized membrane protein
LGFPCKNTIFFVSLQLITYLLHLTNRNKNREDMKKFWTVLIMLTLTLSFSVVSAAPRHRHHPQMEATAPVKSTNYPSGDKKINSTNRPINAYSDTTSRVDSNKVDSIDKASDSNQNYDYNDHGPSRWFDKILGGTVGIGGILFAMLVVILVFLFLTSPLIVIALIAWWLIKRKNKRMDLAQKAAEKGHPIPESDVQIEKQSDKYLLKRGLRNGFLGLGLMVMFWFWKASFLAGIAALVFVYGAGQAFIAWASINKALHLGKNNEQKVQDGGQNETNAKDKTVDEKEESVASDDGLDGKQENPESDAPSTEDSSEKE